MSGRARGLIRFLVSAAIGLCIALSVSNSRTGAVAAIAPAGANQLLWRLSDGCFVAGMLLTACGAITWISTTGFFDIFAYGFKSLLVLFTPLKNPDRQKKYYQYKQEKDEKRPKALIQPLIVGICFLLAALLLSRML